MLLWRPCNGTLLIWLESYTTQARSLMRSIVSASSILGLRFYSRVELATPQSRKQESQWAMPEDPDRVRVALVGQPETNYVKCKPIAC